MRSGLPPEIELQLAKMLTQMNCFDQVDLVLTSYLSKKPDDLRIWIELAAVQMLRGNKDRSLDALRKAVEKGGEPIRSALRKDQRFRSMWNDPSFQALIPPPAQKTIPFGSLSF